MKYKQKILIGITLLAPMLSFAANNCPPGSTYEKAVYVRDVGEANASIQERELNNIWVPNHHDFGVHGRTDDGIDCVECIGLFADSFLDAAVGAYLYLYLFGLDSSIGWVDANVTSSMSTRGPVDESDDIAEEYYNAWIFDFYENIIGPRPSGYHLILFMCQNFADDLYN